MDSTLWPGLRPCEGYQSRLYIEDYPCLSNIYTPWQNVGEVKSITSGIRDIDKLRLKQEAITDVSLDEAIKERTAGLEY